MYRKKVVSYLFSDVINHQKTNFYTHRIFLINRIKSSTFTGHDEKIRIVRETYLSIIASEFKHLEPKSLSFYRHQGRPKQFGSQKGGMRQRQQYRNGLQVFESCFSLVDPTRIHNYLLIRWQCISHSSLKMWMLCNILDSHDQYKFSRTSLLSSSTASASNNKKGQFIYTML